MAIAQKGTRKIVVEGESYRWVVSPDDEPGLGIVVEKDGGHGQRLVAWVEHGNSGAPALVRKVILFALAQGWTPSERKKEMTLRLDNEFIGEIEGAPRQATPNKRMQRTRITAALLTSISRARR